MFVDFYNGELYPFFCKLIGDFHQSLLSLKELVQYEFELLISDEFICNAVSNFGIALYIFFFIAVGFLLWKFIKFLFNLFFRR